VTGGAETQEKKERNKEENERGEVTVRRKTGGRQLRRALKKLREWRNSKKA